jgi:predicted metal-dependent peptidase
MILTPLNPSERITKAKINLMDSFPFYSYILMNCDIKELPNLKTFACDSKGNIFYDAEFLTKLTDSEIKAILSHEVLHICLTHLKRLENKNQKVWNISADLVVNSILLKDGFSLVNGSLIPENNYNGETYYKFRNSVWGFEYVIRNLNNKCVEQVYDEIKDLFKDDKQEQDNYGGCDKHIFDEGEETKSQNEKDEQPEKDFKQILNDAYSFAKNKGYENANLKRALDSVNSSALNWKDRLNKFITKEMNKDISYSKPNRRFLGNGLILPSPIKENVNIIVALDVSGSISKKEYSTFVNELDNITKSFDNLKVKLITFDDRIRVNMDLDIQNFDKNKLDLSGGGGTDLNIVYDLINKEHNHVGGLVVFTDGFVGSIDTKPENLNQIFILTHERNAETLRQYGDVVLMD